MLFYPRTPLRICALALCLMLIVPSVALGDHEVVLPYPKELIVNVKTEEWEAEGFDDIEVDIPETCDKLANARIRSRMKKLFAQTIAAAKPDDRISMRATYRVSGTDWVGIMLSGRVQKLGMSEHRSYETQKTMYLCYDVQTYDMSNGMLIKLNNVFPEDSKAWEDISELARKTLGAYYADMKHDEAALDRLCSVEALRAMSFLPCAGKLLLTFPLEEVVRSKPQLVQVSLPYPDYRPLMTEEARAQTDNSARPIIALTYDDGPMIGCTPILQRNLNRYGATATFFCIGDSVTMWPDMVRTSMDDGHAIGSHTMEHKYAYQVRGNALESDRFACEDLHAELLGIKPTLFRAPGGSFERYVEFSIGWPLIQWGSSAGDTGNNTATALARHVTTNAVDGGIILLHDTYKKTAKGAEMYLGEFVERGFMFATVEELMCLHGITPEPNKVYVDTYGEYVP